MDRKLHICRVQTRQGRTLKNQWALYRSKSKELILARADSISTIAYVAGVWKGIIERQEAKHG